MARMRAGVSFGPLMKKGLPSLPNIKVSEQAPASTSPKIASIVEVSLAADSPDQPHREWHPGSACVRGRVRSRLTFVHRTAPPGGIAVRSRPSPHKCGRCRCRTGSTTSGTGRTDPLMPPGCGQSDWPTIPRVSSSRRRLPFGERPSLPICAGATRHFCHSWTSPFPAPANRAVPKRT